MKFSKRSRYGIQALIDLGIYAKTECVQLKDVSERNDISVKYLEQIFTALRKAGFVKSTKVHRADICLENYRRKFAYLM